MTKVSNVPTIRRLPGYLHLLKELKEEGRKNVSTTYLASEMQIDPIVIRKDLTMTGAEGKPRTGFIVTELIDAIENFLGWRRTTDAFLVGAGNIGSALLGYSGFASYGLRIVDAFDSSPAKIGTMVHGHLILPMEKLASRVETAKVKLGILTVPADAAQETADRMVEAGILGIWNFTPVKLKAPAHVVTQKEDLAAGLAELSVRVKRREAG